MGNCLLLRCSKNMNYVLWPCPLAEYTDIGIKINHVQIRLSNSNLNKRRLMYSIAHVSYHPLSYQQGTNFQLEVRNTSSITPIAASSPAQRLILGPPDLSSLRVLFSLELRLDTLFHIRMKLLSVLGLRGFGVGRLVDLRRGTRRAECACGLFLKLFKDLLFFFGESWWCGALTECEGWFGVVGAADAGG